MKMNNLKLSFDNSFFEEEKKCDYLISTEQKKIWAIELDLLNELLRVCDKHGLKVFAWGGTLIGAVRHDGFIPWDDDVDVCMSREDYEKLGKVAEEEFKHPYFYQTAYTDKEFFIGYSRLRNSETTGVVYCNKSENYNNGIYIDIIVMDDYIEDEKKLDYQLFKIRVAQFLCLSFTSDSKDWKGFKKIASKIVHFCLKPFIKYENLIKQYEQQLQLYKNKSDKVSQMFAPKKIITKQWGLKKQFEEIQLHKFENLNIPIPKDYDNILKHFYGNYMEFPPIEKRGVWHEGVIFFNPDIPYKEYIMEDNKK